MKNIKLLVYLIFIFIFISCGTLIDLDFDAIPELILMHHPFYPDLSIFKFDGDTLKEIKTIENIFADKGYMTEFRVILPVPTQTMVMDGM